MSEITIELESEDELEFIYSALANCPLVFHEDVGKDTEIRERLIERVEEKFAELNVEGEIE